MVKARNSTKDSFTAKTTRLIPYRYLDGCPFKPLIKEIQRSPYEGIGKPEPLKHGLASYWSRRINDEHRIVYKCADKAILIAQLRYHYGT